jgi:hypothetical protein
MDHDSLKGVDHRYLSEILDSKALHIDTEDSLLDFIMELGNDYSDLLGFVRTEYLSVRGLDQLLKSISIAEIDERLWLSLCHRLRLSIPSLPGSDLQSRHHRFETPFASVVACQVFRFDPSRPFDGIFSYLTRECGGNIHAKGVVSITASANCRNQCHQLVDFNWTDYWYADNRQNLWVQFDLNGRSISVTDYTLKSDGHSQPHLVQWSLEGSNDGESWIPLDQRKTRDLDGKYVVKLYQCSSLQSPREFFRLIRLMQTGPDSSGFHRLRLSNLELFGILVESTVADRSQK